MRQLNIPFADQHYLDLNPLFCGYHDCESGHAFGPFVRDYYLIHYVRAGCGIFRRGGITYPVHAGQIFIILPKEETFYQADQRNPWHYCWIGFGGRLGARFGELESPVLDVDGTPFEEMMQLMNDRGNVAYVAAILHRLYAEVFSPREREPDHARRAASFLRSLYMNPITVEQTAAAVGLDRRYLSRLFRARYGVSMQQYLLHIRLEKSKELLQSGYPVALAAAMVGYDDYTGYSKLFRKHVGISPKQYAKQTSTGM